MAQVNSYLGRVRFLVCDPNLFMRTIIKNVLFVYGCKSIGEAESSEDAFSLYRASPPPDIVITEFRMGGEMSGAHFIRKVRNDPDSPNPFVPIIMLTAAADLDTVILARDAGVTEFVAKPISARVLMRHIAEVVENPRPFVKIPTYFGPDRRRRRAGDAPETDRRRSGNINWRRKDGALSQYEIDRLIAGQEIRGRIEMSDHAKEAVARMRQNRQIQEQSEDDALMTPPAKRPGGGR